MVYILAYLIMFYKKKTSVMRINSTRRRAIKTLICVSDVYFSQNFCLSICWCYFVFVCMCPTALCCKRSALRAHLVAISSKMSSTIWRSRNKFCGMRRIRRITRAWLFIAPHLPSMLTLFIIHRSSTHFFVCLYVFSSYR